MPHPGTWYSIWSLPGLVLGAILDKTWNLIEDDATFEAFWLLRTALGVILFVYINLSRSRLSFGLQPGAAELSGGVPQNQSLVGAQKVAGKVAGVVYRKPRKIGKICNLGSEVVCRSIFIGNFENRVGQNSLVLFCSFRTSNFSVSYSKNNENLLFVWFSELLVMTHGPQKPSFWFLDPPKYSK